MFSLSALYSHKFSTVVLLGVCLLTTRFSAASLNVGFPGFRLHLVTPQAGSLVTFVSFYRTFLFFGRT